MVQPTEVEVGSFIAKGGAGSITKGTFQNAPVAIKTLMFDSETKGLWNTFQEFGNEITLQSGMCGVPPFSLPCQTPSRSFLSHPFVPSTGNGVPLGWRSLGPSSPLPLSPSPFSRFWVPSPSPSFSLVQ